MQFYTSSIFLSFLQTRRCILDNQFNLLFWFAANYPAVGGYNGSPSLLPGLVLAPSIVHFLQVIVKRSNLLSEITPIKPAS